MPRECTGHSKHLLPTTQKEDSTHGHHQMVNTKIKLIIFCSQRWRSSIQSAKKRLGADCGSDHELLIAKFRLKLKKVGKTTRPRYDVNKSFMIMQYGHLVNKKEAKCEDLRCPLRSLTHDEFREGFSVFLSVPLQVPSHVLFQ